MRRNSKIIHSITRRESRQENFFELKMRSRKKSRKKKKEKKEKKKKKTKKTVERN